jgi:hypothetical protein
VKPSPAVRRLNGGCENGAHTVLPFSLPPSLVVCLALLLTGCTSFKEFVQNGFKAGPNYERSPAPLARPGLMRKTPESKAFQPTTVPGGPSSAIPF